MMTMVRGVRGATTCAGNTCEAIQAAAQELLLEIAAANEIQMEDVASMFFTTTKDLTACYPAKAARDLGWTNVPLLGAIEMDVPDGPAFCIRVLIHWNTTKRQDEVVHVYLHGAASLRPDLVRRRERTS